MDVTVSAVSARLYTDTMCTCDLFGCFYILCDPCSWNNYVTLFLCDRIGFHSFQDSASDTPYSTCTLRRSCDTAVQSSVCQSCFRCCLHCAVQLLLTGSIIHNDQHCFSLFYREHFVQIAFYDIDQFSFQKLDGCWHKRQLQNLRDHVCTFLKTPERHYKGTGTGRCGKKLQRYLSQNT